MILSAYNTVWYGIVCFTIVQLFTLSVYSRDMLFSQIKRVLFESKPLNRNYFWDDLDAIHAYLFRANLLTEFDRDEVSESFKASEHITPLPIPPSVFTQLAHSLRAAAVERYNDKVVWVYGCHLYLQEKISASFHSYEVLIHGLWQAHIAYLAMTHWLINGWINRRVNTPITHHLTPSATLCWIRSKWTRYVCMYVCMY